MLFFAFLFNATSLSFSDYASYQYDTLSPRRLSHSCVRTLNSSTTEKIIWYKSLESNDGVPLLKFWNLHTSIVYDIKKIMKLILLLPLLYTHCRVVFIPFSSIVRRSCIVMRKCAFLHFYCLVATIKYIKIIVFWSTQYYSFHFSSLQNEKWA